MPRPLYYTASSLRKARKQSNTTKAKDKIYRQYYVCPVTGERKFTFMVNGRSFLEHLARKNNS